MKYGVTIFLTDQSIDPVTVAKEAEARGFSGLWLPEHTHIPASRRTPWPGGAELPEWYRRTVDPLVALAAAAAATERIILGTGILLAAQRDPLVTAKAVATLDRISGGRVELGIGYGWNEEEMSAHGVEPKRRRTRTQEHVLAMTQLWAQDEASFDGKYVNFEPSWSWPKPEQRGADNAPRVPLLLGSSPGSRAYDQIVEAYDGWMPLRNYGAQDFAELRQQWEDAGRDPQHLRIAPFGVPAQNERLDELESMGVEEVTLGLPSAPADVVIARLDKLAALIESRG
ncbi:MAG: LLM class F420-dependent oxidoreductase [Cumulibacter sp.]